MLYEVITDAVGLDPAHESDGESFKVCDNLYEGLVRFADDGTKVEPAEDHRMKSFFSVLTLLLCTLASSAALGQSYRQPGISASPTRNG